MDCPKCKLVNPPTAERCDCGYDFKTGVMKESYLSERDKRLSKPAIAGIIVLALAVVRVASRLAVINMGGDAGEKSGWLLTLTLVLLAAVLGFWAWKKKASR